MPRVTCDEPEMQQLGTDASNGVRRKCQRLDDSCPSPPLAAGGEDLDDALFVRSTTALASVGSFEPAVLQADGQDGARLGACSARFRASATSRAGSVDRA
jgi:hypothetical protein